MSYYKKSRFKLTNHSLLRVKERLRLSGDDVKVSSDILIMIEKCYMEFSLKNGDMYYKVPRKIDWYFVVSRDFTIITVTPISHAKKIQLYEDQ